jgi:hypothetical protein
VLLALKTAFTMTRTKDVNNVEQLSYASFNKETFCSAAMLARLVAKVGRALATTGASPRVPLLSEYMHVHVLHYWYYHASHIYLLVHACTYMRMQSCVCCAYTCTCACTCTCAPIDSYTHMHSACVVLSHQARGAADLAA